MQLEHPTEKLPLCRLVENSRSFRNTSVMKSAHMFKLHAVGPAADGLIQAKGRRPG